MDASLNKHLVQRNQHGKLGVCTQAKDCFIILLNYVLLFCSIQKNTFALFYLVLSTSEPTIVTVYSWATQNGAMSIGKCYIL